jgi:cell division septation protein DedD
MRTQLKALAIIFGLAIAAGLMLFAYRISGESPGEPETVVSGAHSQNDRRSELDQTADRGRVAPSAGKGEAAGEGEKKRVKTVTIRPDSETSRKWAVDSQRLGLNSTTNPNQIVPTPDEPRRVRTVPVRPDYDSPGKPSAERAPPHSPGGDPSASDPAGGYVVQVASQRSEMDAEASFHALQAKYPDLLGNRRAIVTRADLGERGVFYRAQVGPFALAEEAAKLCASLKEAGAQCIVQRN